MPSSVFEIKEHTVECQHIREYARATAHSQEDVLQLSIKQYIPLDNQHPEVGDLTIIGAHANGFAKVSALYRPSRWVEITETLQEMYEPLWEELYSVSKTKGFRIRSIWIADVAQQGASGVLNENVLGDDRKWLCIPLYKINL